MKIQRVHLANEWIGCQIESTADDRNKKMSALRGKIKQHFESQAHDVAMGIFETSKKELLQELNNKSILQKMSTTVKVLRTVYYLAHSDRPFSDHEHLIQLQTLNGVDSGHILHSRYSATSIADHIARELKRKVVNTLKLHETKIAVVVDEATTLGMSSALAVHLKAYFGVGEPEFVFFALLELQSQNAQCITDSLLACLRADFSEDYLQANWIAFVSDGASVMLGKKNGVAARLIAVYSRVFVWHCMNHRLKLAVGDAVDDVTNVNQFKHFIDSLYALYSMS